MKVREDNATIVKVVTFIRKEKGEMNESIVEKS